MYCGVYNNYKNKVYGKNSANDAMNQVQNYFVLYIK